MQTSVSQIRVMAFAVSALLLAAACASSPQTPRAGPSTSATVTNMATSSAAGRTSTATSTATPGTTSITRASTTKAPTSSNPTSRASTTAPTATIPRSLAGQVVTHIPTSRKVVALTFDAGANGDGVDSILATLARERVGASFFLTGDFVAGHPALARRMSAAGRLGNHTTDHPHLPPLTDTQVRAQITGARTTILRVTGKDPRPLFRFPFGDSSPRDLKMVNALGYVAVGWTIDTLGWQGTSGARSVNSVVQRVLAAATPGEIVLMHVGSHPSDRSTLDADALPRVISGLRAAGYGFVTLDAVVP